MKVDRRVARTRGALRDALLALITERGYDGLTVENITERANLRRATFYMHYRDKDELLLAALTETFDALVRETAHYAQSDVFGGKTQPAAFLATFRHVEAHHALYRAILSGKAGMMVARRVRDYLSSVVSAPLQAISPGQLAMPADRPYTAEQMADWVHRLTMRGALSAFSGGLLISTAG
jgi:AcrR family transcriptional regulator